jgi:hypothetical protein
MLTIFSSWIVGPTGVLFLHHLGWGADPMLTSILLALSAAAPIQLLLNEFVAAGATARNFFVSRVQMSMLMVLTVVVINLALTSSNKINGEEPFYFAYLSIALLTALSIWISYYTSVAFYTAVISGATSPKQAILIGSAPGILTLASFVIASLRQEPSLLLLGAILPAIGQLVLSKFLLGRLGQTNLESSRRPIKLHNCVLATMAGTLMVIGFASTMLRDYLASAQTSYAAVILTGINLTGTLVMSFSRTLYLAAGRSLGKEPAMILLLFVVAAFATFSVLPHLSALAAILALQIAVVLILGAGRTIGAQRIGTVLNG